MSKKIQESIITGMGIGFPITLLCMILIGGMNSVIAEFLTWMIASALYGLLSGVIFQADSPLSLPVSMALHGTGCLLITLAAAHLCGYAESFSALLLGILPVFIVIYAIVYTLCMLSMKANEKRINRMLDDR